MLRLPSRSRARALLLGVCALAVATTLGPACTTSGGGRVATPTDSPPTATPTATLSPTPLFTATPTCAPTGVGTPVTLVVDCWTGGTSCSVCGVVSYLCFNTPSTCLFGDPCPAGTTPRQISADLNGVACSTLSFTTEINGQLLGASIGIVTNCVCSCSTWTHTSPYTCAPFPGYVSAGSNTFSIAAISGTICLSSVDLTLTCL